MVMRITGQPVGAPVLPQPWEAAKSARLFLASSVVAQARADWQAITKVLKDFATSPQIRESLTRLCERIPENQSSEIRIAITALDYVFLLNPKETPRGSFRHLVLQQLVEEIAVDPDHDRAETAFSHLIQFMSEGASYLSLAWIVRRFGYE